jgi:hypothetical protein
MKILPLVPVLALSFASLAYAADAPPPPTKSEPATPAATEPVKVSPELMQADAKLTVLQTHMNVLLAQRDALDAQIKAFQLNIDKEKSMKDKLSK